MSRPEIIICDKCGEEIPTWCAKQHSAKIQMWAVGVGRYEGGQRIDLCEECYNKFVAFLETNE
jgi:hypothetical protein